MAQRTKPQKQPVGRWPLSRRSVLAGAGALIGGIGLRPLAALASEFELSSAADAALAKSPLVYVSPLLANGQESRCHGEVWFFVDRGDVVVYTAKDTWKAVALGKGRDRARIWVGDFGPVGRAGDRYRSAPTFLARASIDRDQATFDRLMANYAKRYASEWGKWGPRFQNGWDNGGRVMIRYAPTGA